MSIEDLDYEDFFDDVVDTNLGQYSILDGDTITNQKGHSIRVKGIDTAETQHLVGSTGEYKPGDWQGDVHKRVLADIIAGGNFTNIDLTGETTYGRDVGILRDPNGNRIDEEAYYNGILPVNHFTSDRNVQLANDGSFARAVDQDIGIERNDMWSQARDKIREVSDKTLVRKKDGSPLLKQTAVDERDLAAMKSVYGEDFSIYTANTVQFRNYDRDYDNQAYSEWSSGLDVGFLSLQKAWYGLKSETGDILGDQELFLSGKLDVDSINYEMSELPDFTQDFKDVNSFSDFGDYAVGQAGVALPWMIGIIGSFGIGAIAAPGMLGIAIGATPVALAYSGEVYSNMEGNMDERNAGIALSTGVAMAVLDRLGLEAILHPSAILKDHAHKMLASAYLKKYPNIGSIEAAQALINKAITKEYVKTIQRLAQLSAVVLGKKAYAKLAAEAVRGTVTGAVGEGITELAQEGLGYAGSVYGSKATWNQEEFERTLINSAIGGATIGGGIGTVVRPAQGYRDFKNEQRRFSISAEDPSAGFEKGHTRTSLIDDVIETGGVDGNGIKGGNHQIEVAEEFMPGRAKDTWSAKGWMKGLAELPMRAVASGADFIHKTLLKNMKGFSPELKRVSKALLGYLNTFSHFAEGDDLASTKLTMRHGYKTAKNVIRSNIAAVFKDVVPNYWTQDNEWKSMSRMRDFMRALKEGKTDEELQALFKGLDIPALKEVSKSITDFAVDFEKQMNILADENNELYNKQGVSISTDEDAKFFEFDEESFFDKTEFDRTFIRKNKAAFISAVMEAEGISYEKAEEFYDEYALIDNARNANKERIGRQRKTPESVLGMLTNLKSNPIMQKYLYNDVFAQLDQKIDEVVGWAVDLKFRGTNDIKLAKLLNEYKRLAESEGIYDSRVITHIIDVLDGSEGKYKQLESERMASIQENITLINGLNQLDSAALASTVELITAFFRTAGTGTTAELIRKAVKEGIIPLLKHNARETAKYVKKGSGLTIEEDHHNVVSMLYSGQLSHEAGVLGHVDIAPTTKFKAKLMRAFFSVTGLKYITDFVRVSRWAFAHDAVIKDLEVMAVYWNGDGSNTQLVNDAYDRLRDLRIDPETTATRYKVLLDDTRIVGMTENELYQHIQEHYPDLYKSLELARKSYVEMAAVKPDATTKPLWALNPRWRLLTQYNSFIFTFTSQTMPRIWKDVKGADPNMQYNVVMMMAFMLVAAYLSQEMKDEWKFGGENPYLSDNEKKFRALKASGLLGSPGQLSDLFYPLYGGSSDKGPYSWSKLATDVGDRGKTLLGPTYSTATDIYKAAKHSFGDNEALGQYYRRKLVPIAGGTSRYTGNYPGGY